LSAEKEPGTADWSDQFLSQKSSVLPQTDMKWAEEYLDQSEHRPW